MFFNNFYNLFYLYCALNYVDFLLIFNSGQPGSRQILGHCQFNAQFMFPVKVVHWLSEKPEQDHEKKMKVVLSERKPSFIYFFSYF